MSWIWTLVKVIEPFYWALFGIAVTLALVVPNARKKRITATVIVCTVFSPLPLMYLSSWSTKFSVRGDWEYYQELCRTQAGDKIYRTVDNVEGIFQMKPRNPDPDQTNRKYQYTMERAAKQPQYFFKQPAWWKLYPDY